MMCLVTVREIKKTWSAQKNLSKKKSLLIGQRRDTLRGKYPVFENKNYSVIRIQYAGHLVDAYQRTAIDWKALATQWGVVGGLEAIA